MSEFERRREHAYNKLLWHVPERQRLGRFLDIGCGVGNGVVAALQHGASLAVGVDRDLAEFAHLDDPADFPAHCAGHDVDPARALLIEGDLFQFQCRPESFDAAMMLDSAEHVPDPQRFFRWAARALRPGGRFVVDTCPLYYSPLGHHLFETFPEHRYPWAHLRHDFPELLDAAAVTPWHLDRYRELNRITHDGIRDAFLAAGFSIVQEHRAQPTAERVALLGEHRAMLALEGVDERLLFEDWILLVGDKT